MSGRGGGGGDFEPTRKPSCDEIAEKTVLNSPVPAVLDELKKGDVLKLRVQTTANAKTVRAYWGQKVAGSITFANLRTLINCLEDGHTYTATVVEIRSGRCEVLIEPES